MGVVIKRSQLKTNNNSNTLKEIQLHLNPIQHTTTTEQDTKDLEASLMACQLHKASTPKSSIIFKQHLDHGFHNGELRPLQNHIFKLMTLGWLYGGGDNEQVVLISV